MATAADIRAVTPDAPKRGTLPLHITEAWDLEHPEDPYQASPRRDSDTPDAEPDYSDGDLEDLFDDVPETKPRKPRPKKPTPGGRVASLFGPKKKTGGKKTPRVSTEDLIGGVWRAAAKLATPLPPLQRTLRLQAPVAGLLLEDAVRDTIVDPFLQPVARLAGAGKTVTALAGPPAFVTAIMLHTQQAAQQNTPPNPLFMTVATEGLRASLMSWYEVAGDKFAIALEREKEFESKYGQSVDDLIALLFSDIPTTPAETEAEEEAIRRAQGVL
jgi:hypothetical protein